MQQIIKVVSYLLLLLLSLFCSSAQASAGNLRQSNKSEAVKDVDRKLNSRGIPYPEDRFLPWVLLDKDVQSLAEDIMDYNEITWNNVGTAENELLSYETIDKAMRKKKTIDTDDALARLGFPDGEEQWECWMNHYEDYDWKDLKEIRIVAYWKTLGYNENSWEDEDFLAPSDAKDWRDLTQEEQSAASELCFIQETWDQYSIVDWYDLYTLQVTEGDNTTLAHVMQFSNPSSNRSNFPAQRFLYWQNLTNVQLEAATTLGYNKSTWENLDTNPVERIPFWNLTLDHQNAVAVLFGSGEEDEDATTGTVSIGNIWDCWIHHYFEYTWGQMKGQELYGNGVGIFWKVLGYDFRSWNDLEPEPLTVNTTFANLTQAEQYAAGELCYLPQLWDRIALGSWVNDYVV